MNYSESARKSEHRYSFDYGGIPSHNYNLPLCCYITAMVACQNGGLSLQLTVILSGGALLLCSTSIAYTEVVRAMLLFLSNTDMGNTFIQNIFSEPITQVA